VFLRDGKREQRQRNRQTFWYFFHEMWWEICETGGVVLIAAAYVIFVWLING
jgi:hypothetical protein